MRLLPIIMICSLAACEALISDDADAVDGTTSGGSESCVSDISIGSGIANPAGQLGAACAPSTDPANCVDGSYIRFNDTDECVCIAKCSSLGVSQGNACDQNGLYICQSVQGTSGGPFCIASSWNVCGDASGGGGSSGGDGASGGGDGNDGTTGGEGGDGSTCKPDGLPCDDDAECCSLACFASGCG